MRAGRPPDSGPAALQGQTRRPGGGGKLSASESGKLHLLPGVNVHSPLSAFVHIIVQTPYCCSSCIKKFV